MEGYGGYVASRAAEGVGLALLVEGFEGYSLVRQSVLSGGRVLLCP